MKVLDKIITVKLDNIDLCIDSLGGHPPPQITNIKLNRKIDNWDCMKPKSFFTEQKVTSKIKRQHIQWNKGCANHISYNGLISNIYKESKLFNNRNNNNPIKS